MATNFYQFGFSELHRACASANLLYNWHYKRNRRALLVHNNLSKKCRSFLSDVDFSVPRIHEVLQSPDKTVKFQFELMDGARVETVLIPFQGKYTACLSSQVGCAMNCSFCFTGRQGFSRNLRAEEIVGQLVEAKRWLTLNRPDDDRVLNIVYMGQGEPLHNFDAVKRSAEIFLSQHGLSFAAHKITISTAGFLPGLKRWRAEMPDVNIALSLHAVDEEKRSRLIPINAKYPLSEILPIVDSIPQGEKRFVTYEYLLVKDFNDSAVDAEAVGRLLKGRKAYVNLIPFNPFPGGATFARPEVERVLAFKSVLDGFEIPTMIRSTKGDAILAACGQLNTRSSGSSMSS